MRFGLVRLKDWLFFFQNALARFGTLRQAVVWIVQYAVAVQQKCFSFSESVVLSSVNSCESAVNFSCVFADLVLF